MKPNVKAIRHKWGGIIVRAACVAVGISMVLLVMWMGMGRIYDELEGQIRNSMRDVANQNAVALRAEMLARANLLRGMAASLPEDREGIKAQLQHMHATRDLYTYRRVGYIEPDGSAYTGDGVETDLAHREYFQRAMLGHIAVSDSIYDTVGDVGEYINIIAVPVYTYDRTAVQGVLFATYRTSRFRELLSIECFGGQGISGAVLHDGEVVVGSERNALMERDNLFEVIASYGTHNDGAVAAMKADFAAEREGFTVFTSNEEKYIYYTPVTLLDGEVNWHLTTIVPASVLDERVEPIRATVSVLGAVSILTVLAFLVVLTYTFWQQRRQLEALAYQDPLTRGDNYTAFRTKLRERRQAGYIISADLSDFKMINNTCGARQGDALIVAMWKVLSGMCGSGELAAHISGDNFVLFLRGRDPEEIVCRVEHCSAEIHKLSDRLDIPHVVPKFGIYATDDCSYPEDGYGKANLAKKQLADRVDACCALYSEELRQRSLADQWMEDNFDLALEREQFEVWFQPKYSPATGRSVGAEALIRWRREDGTLISPGQFIPLFERNGLIARLDRYAFRKACQAQRSWLDNGWAVLPVSVNVSRASLFYSDIVDTYLSIVRETGIDLSLIQLEITESAMIDNEWAQSLIHRFRQAGFSVLLDDFGSGYSSMALLSTNCFRTIKLDKSLIDCIGDERGEALLTQISNLAHGLGLSITAEGVEQQEQVRFLADIRCDDIQGYYYCRPLPAAEYEAILQEHS